MELEVTFDKNELENMLKDLLKRQGLKLSENAGSPILWKTRKDAFKVVIKAEVDPSAATAALDKLYGEETIPVELDDGEEETPENLDLTMFPDSTAAEGLQQAAADEKASKVPPIPGETKTRQNKAVKRRQSRKPTRKDRGAGR